MFRLLKAHQCTLRCVWVAVQQVLQGHLLKAVEFIPLRGSTGGFEGETRFEDISNQLTAGRCKCIHGERIKLKFEVCEVKCIHSLHYVQRVYTRNSLLDLEGNVFEAFSLDACALLTLHLQGHQLSQHLNLLFQGRES